jgi:hypothetical protein
VTARSRSEEHGENQAPTAVTISRERERYYLGETQTSCSSEEYRHRCAEFVQKAPIVKHVVVRCVADTIGELA